MSLFACPVLAQQLDVSVFQGIAEYVQPLWDSFKRNFVGEDLFIQLGCVAGAILLSYVLLLGLRPLFKKWTEAIEHRDDWLEGAVDWLSGNLFRFLLVALLWAVSVSFDAYHEALLRGEVREISVPSVVEVETQDGQVHLQQITELPAGPGAKVERVKKNYILIRALASLATLWLMTGALPRKIKTQAYFKTLFFVLAIGLILNLLGVWQSIRDGLNSLRLLPISESGETQVTALTLVKGVIAILVIIPLTRWVIRSVDSQVSKMETVSPALRVLSLKVLKICITGVAVLFVISSVGINLSAFAVLGGAIGLGLGFGFQKVISNLISGVILLGDRSIKPGDVIEVDNTYGWINTLGARYASVITRDGTEHLIPNEMLITEKVVNWSFSDENVRVKIPFGVSYHSDVHKVMDLVLEVGRRQTRVLADPSPVVRMMGFGDNSVDFELRVWIRDPSKGVNNVKSDIYLAIWDAFKEHDIEIPFPQRDLHLVNAVPLEVKVKSDK